VCGNPEARRGICLGKAGDNAFKREMWYIKDNETYFLYKDNFYEGESEWHCYYGRNKYDGENVCIDGDDGFTELNEEGYNIFEIRHGSEFDPIPVGVEEQVENQQQVADKQVASKEQVMVPQGRPISDPQQAANKQQGTNKEQAMVHVSRPNYDDPPLVYEKALAPHKKEQTKKRR
jgi:hypothetical protein